MSNHNLAQLSMRGQLLKKESLANYTSWRAGGAADYVFIATDLSDLANFLQQLPVEVPITWLGLGSNTLVRDGGLPGVAIITQGVLSKINQIGSHEVRAEAGVSAAQLARYTARLGKQGLEFMAGIPGTVGGALAMNAGCFGGETWQWVKSVETINRQGFIQQRSITDFKISYRHVVRPEEEWFVAGHFNLADGDKKESLNRIRTFLERRSATQPTGTANCGSVFRNPPNNYAGLLIESCGLKGLQIGGARVSEKHANFIINEEHATAADIEALILSVKQKVFEQKQIELVPEVCIIGKSR